jgi:hypothetical protein
MMQQRGGGLIKRRRVRGVEVKMESFCLPVNLHAAFGKNAPSSRLIYGGERRRRHRAHYST